MCARAVGAMPSCRCSGECGCALRNCVGQSHHAAHPSRISARPRANRGASTLQPNLAQRSCTTSGRSVATEAGGFVVGGEQTALDRRNDEAPHPPAHREHLIAGRLQQWHDLARDVVVLEHDVDNPSRVERLPPPAQDVELEAFRRTSIFIRPMRVSPSASSSIATETGIAFEPAVGTVARLAAPVRSTEKFCRSTSWAVPAVSPSAALWRSTVADGRRPAVISTFCRRIANRSGVQLNATTRPHQRPAAAAARTVM